MTVVMDQYKGKNFAMYNSDCVKFAQELPDNSIDFSIYSPPYSSLYVYSESAADMGNVDDDKAFCEQYRFLVRELFRVTRPGRLVAIHVKDLVYYQGSSERGTSGLRPFSDMCTQVHMEEGFDFHCRVSIFRDPVLERSKTNAHGLLWKTFKKDATFCRVGMPEYLILFRKWAKEGEEDLVKPVEHPAEDIPLICWQELASPIWNVLNVDAWNFKPYQSGSGDFDLPATDVLNVKQAKDENAEKHLCPMPLNITERALNLWTNAGDVVFSPFAGIGSEGVATLRNNRKFIGTELNPIYYSQAVKHLESVESTGTQTSIFDVLGVKNEL
jgi:DNA modification methylase